MRNLDNLATEEEIKKSMKLKIGEDAEQVNIRGLRKSFRGKQMAILSMPRTIAAKLLKEGFIEVGWDMCPIRERHAQKRCYKCLCFGHKAENCTSAKDRTNWCLRCGQTEHKAATCNNKPVCFNCVDAKRTDVSHYTGSRRCPLATTGEQDASKKWITSEIASYDIAQGVAIEFTKYEVEFHKARYLARYCGMLCMTAFYE
ncbi:uncharacterized protein LOC124460866 [Drosophila willistoni]|uniref:uncharacterized protein LOC124460866 n=1 Tax=Drosophila willistoni TaxID=7260 RepID=UPI001F079C2A|nr:uncharacterized protein LOC124460866 [Drosophila willistoni]